MNGGRCADAAKILDKLSRMAVAVRKRE